MGWNPLTLRGRMRDSAGPNGQLGQARNAAAGWLIPGLCAASIKRKGARPELLRPVSLPTGRRGG
jgi:hypothetical protein